MTLVNADELVLLTPDPWARPWP